MIGPKDLDGFELERIRTDTRKPDRDRTAAAIELQRRSEMDGMDLLELDAWTVDCSEDRWDPDQRIDAGP